MSDCPQRHELKGRLLGGTELNWCRAVSCGTGISVLALQVSKEPDISLLQNALNKLQNAHPVLKSMLHKHTSTNTFSFIIPPTPSLRLKPFHLSTTSDLLQTLSTPSNKSLSPFQLILEHELNINSWSDPSAGTPVFFANLYALPGTKWALVLRLHTAVCDPITALSLLHELMELAVKGDGSGTQRELENKGEVSLGIEDLIPTGKAKKPLWAHGLDMLGYSINSLRLTNLRFKDVKGPRSTEVVRLQMNKQETDMLLAGCKTRGIKLCGALAAAGLIAGHSSKPHHRGSKYAVVTLTDCRSTLQPPLSSHNFGFYHSAILNTHVVKGGDNLWDLARKSYTAFANSKKCNKHFTDMADLNYLMCKAIENPSLTASSSLRTSLISVFEDPIIDNSNEMHQEIGLDDYIGCSSVHGVGPSIAIFDTIHDGKLDCACVYPSPLHSREQMQEFVDLMKMVLVDA